MQSVRDAKQSKRCEKGSRGKAESPAHQWVAFACGMAACVFGLIPADAGGGSCVTAVQPLADISHGDDWTLSLFLAAGVVVDGVCVFVLVVPRIPFTLLCSISFFPSPVQSSSAEKSLSLPCLCTQSQSESENRAARKHSHTAAPDANLCTEASASVFFPNLLQSNVRSKYFGFSAPSFFFSCSSLSLIHLLTLTHPFSCIRLTSNSGGIQQEQQQAGRSSKKEQAKERS